MIFKLATYVCSFIFIMSPFIQIQANTVNLQNEALPQHCSTFSYGFLEYNLTFFVPAPYTFWSCFGEPSSEEKYMLFPRKYMIKENSSKTFVANWHLLVNTTENAVARCCVYETESTSTASLEQRYNALLESFKTSYPDSFQILDSGKTEFIGFSSGSSFDRKLPAKWFFLYALR